MIFKAFQNNKTLFINQDQNIISYNIIIGTLLVITKEQIINIISL